MQTEPLVSAETEKQDLIKGVVLLISLGLAVIASQLLVVGRLGLEFIIFAGLCLTTVVCLRYFYQNTLSSMDYGLLASGYIFVMLLVFRYSTVLYGLNLLAIGIILCLAYARRYTGSIENIPVLAWLRTPFWLMRTVITGTVNLLRVNKLPIFIPIKNFSHFRSIALGLLWSAPIVFVFGSLLISADSRFENFTYSLFAIDMTKLFETLIKILLFFPFVAAFLYAIMVDDNFEENRKSSPEISMNGVQLLTVLVSINILFFTYIAVQFGYFFGGEQVINDSNGMTYSAYARRGFWEFIWLSMFILPILLSGHWLQRSEAEKIQNGFKYLAIALVCAVVVIELSAIHRMLIYVQIYGLTELRFYSSVFMLYMIFGLAVFVIAVLRGQRGKYIVTMAGLAVAFILMLNIMNPDALIAKHNLSRDDISALDHSYLSRLSADAIPAIYQSQRYNCLLLNELRSELPQVYAWNQWNWSLDRADRSLDAWAAQCQNK